MKLSVELTLYPLKEDYRDIIRQTVARLNACENVKVRTFPTATILVGDYDKVMALVDDTMRWTYEQYGKCVFIAKFLPGYEAE